jgi:hypothetical protein
VFVRNLSEFKEKFENVEGSYDPFEDDPDYNWQA